MLLAGTVDKAEGAALVPGQIVRHRARERTVRWYDPGHMDPLFLATVEAVEEAVLNALMKAETMTGINSTTVDALPYDRLRDAMKKYGR